MNTFTVIGVGGGGQHALNRIVMEEFHALRTVSMDTNASSLMKSRANVRLHIGGESLMTGSSGNPQHGREAAHRSAGAINELLEGVSTLYLIGGMGAGTATGALPVIAYFAKQRHINTVAVVSTPFSFEGEMRERIAREGVSLLQQQVDTLLLVDADRVLKLGDHATPDMYQVYRWLSGAMAWKVLLHVI